MISQLLQKIFLRFKRWRLLRQAEREYRDEVEQIRDLFRKAVDEAFEKYMPSDLSKEVPRGKEQMQHLEQEVNYQRGIREQRILTARNKYQAKCHEIMTKTSL